MSRLSSAETRGTTPEMAEEILFKPDRPRHIDQYINFFGSGDASAQAGDQLLSTFDEDDD